MFFYVHLKQEILKIFLPRAFFYFPLEMSVSVHSYTFHVAFMDLADTFILFLQWYTTLFCVCDPMGINNLAVANPISFATVSLKVMFQI